MLEALGTLNIHQENDTVFRTGAWAKSIPFGKSPPNGSPEPGFASGSPQSIPNSIPNSVPNSVPSAVDHGAFDHHGPSSASPPPTTRPMSYGSGPASATPSHRLSGDRSKRHSTGTPFQNQPPPPHMPQAHFYSVPDIDIPSPSPVGRAVDDDQYSFCVWDSISGVPPKAAPARFGGKVILTGTDGSLEVLAVENQGTRVIGKLSGLNGRVLDAKLLSTTSHLDPYASSRPHIAVILHGPVPQKDESAEGSSAGSEANEILPGLPGKSAAGERPHREGYYQTKVEVYSLRTGEHIATLFQSKLVPSFESYPNLSLLAPGPVGNLRLYASGPYVVVASGTSGEVFIFGVTPSTSTGGYQCLGKTWTSIQSRESRRYSTSSSSTDQDGSQYDSGSGRASESPILSVSGRWLAVVAPASTVRAPPVGAVPTQLVNRKIYGLDTHIPPSKPAANCGVDCGEGESFLDKVARGVTQEVLRGARWMGDQGIQAWNNYWNKDQQQSQSGAARRASPHSEGQHGFHLFPPTHGQDTSGGSSSEPDIVCILDMKRLEEGQEAKAAFPGLVAAFQPPNGCSFLSFSPNGLMLVSSSKKGDVHHVWDLMHVKHCRLSSFLSEEPGTSTQTSPHVRQVARYARLTASSVVDVIWSYPTGERLAIVTRKGTVHVFDVPRSAFQWPPPRRARTHTNPSKGEASHATTPSEESGSRSPFAAAMKFVGGRTQPIITAVRGRTPSVGSTFPAVSGFGLSSAAGAGGKAVAAGLSKSVGAATGTVNTLRHVGENRLHMSGFSRDPSPSRVTWVAIRGECFLAVMDAGLLKLYKIKRNTDRSKARRNQPAIAGKLLELRLPPNLRSPCGPLQIAPATDSAVTTYWALSSTVPHSSSHAAKLQSQPLSQAEIETNAPYQPFHTDRRVTISVYLNDDVRHEEGEVPAASPSSPWVFGGPIPTRKLPPRSTQEPSDDDETTVGGTDVPTGEMENVISLGSGSDHQHVEEIVITTRRKKKKKRAHPHSDPGAPSPDEDGFFEDDCDVLDFARDRV